MSWIGGVRGVAFPEAGRGFSSTVRPDRKKRDRRVREGKKKGEREKEVARGLSARGGEKPDQFIY